MNKNNHPKILTFQEALGQARKIVADKKCTSKIRLLLGNGFSQSYYGDFGYTTLFEAIKDKKENKRIKEIFEKYGDSNFEGVLRLLQESSWLVEIYGLSAEEIKNDYDRIKRALSEAIVKVHPENTGAIPEEKKKNCFNFINLFDEVFTVNYDLLLYWVIMTQDGEEKFGDYFTRAEDTPDDYCEYFGNSIMKKHIHFLHGALHLFKEKGNTIKIVWGEKVPLVSQICALMDQGKYPLVVAEGSSESKVKQVNENPYLKHAFDKLRGIQGQFFTFGFSMSKQDEHIVNIIKNNDEIRHLWIGIRGDFAKKSNIHFLKLAEDMVNSRNALIKNRHYGKKSKSGDLTVHFYDSGSLNIWGNDISL